MITAVTIEIHLTSVKKYVPTGASVAAGFETLLVDAVVWLT
jgi:hypothetical protein